MVVKIPTWLMLVVSLPGRSQTPRMRLWRALKGAGAAMLRDGVYVLPENDGARALFKAQVDEANQAGGSAHVVPFTSTDPKQEAELRSAFDRTQAYAQALERLAVCAANCGNWLKPRRASDSPPPGVSWKRWPQSTSFRAWHGRRWRPHWPDAEHALNAQFAPDEPRGKKRRFRIAARDYRSRVWATRRHLWIDRVASAWLIRRFIDPRAQFRWLKKPADCPKRAVGFDFDGAEFSHVGARVTFQVLAASFGLDRDPRLARLDA